ncbi:hypothetical protein MNBD_GAMMA12-1347 [hydrothermal vent metagenome]|uniref:Uncharacterized protein n=1 Tax=hydrothermal vent metagenome TaxID=652676 RepID=A0A3B0Y8L5_9ZZZZ
MKHIMVSLILILSANTTYAKPNSNEFETTIRYLSNGSVEITTTMSHKNFKNVNANANKFKGKSNKGLGRKRYLITCHKKKPDGTKESWVEKAYGQWLVVPIAIAGCQAKVVDPSHSIRKL